MKRISKIFLILLVFILGTIFYFYSKPPFSANNEQALHLKYKLLPGKDSMQIFIPYKITLTNNRLLNLQLAGIYDENISTENVLTKNLIYNIDGMELTNFEAMSKKKFEDDYLKTKYRKIIFPFTSRSFYYFKAHTIVRPSTLENNFFEKINEQIIELNNNIDFKISPKVIDSLYLKDDQKRFNINFKNMDKGFMPKYIKAKINNEKQIQVNILDSISGMSKEAAKKYLLEIASSEIKEVLKDFK